MSLEQYDQDIDRMAAGESPYVTDVRPRCQPRRTSPGILFGLKDAVAHREWLNRCAAEQALRDKAKKIAADCDASIAHLNKVVRKATEAILELKERHEGIGAALIIDADRSLRAARKALPAVNFQRS